MTRLTLSIAIVLLLSGGAVAHHGSSMYGSRVVELRHAVVTKFLWSNPHSVVHVEVNGEEWILEAGSPSSMARGGWTRSSLHPGEVVTVFAYAALSGAPAGRLQRVVLASGRELREIR